MTNIALTSIAPTNTAMSRLCMLLILIAGSIAAGQDSQQPAPLTTEQVGRVRAVLSRTKAEQTELRKKLGETQGQLASCYTEFSLDEQRISQLQSDIVATQKKLMDSHHVLHQEMRSILGVERFKSLARRIDWYLSDDSKNAEQQAKNEKQPASNTSKSQTTAESNPTAPSLARDNSPVGSPGK